MICFTSTNFLIMIFIVIDIADFVLGEVFLDITIIVVYYFDLFDVVYLLFYVFIICTCKLTSLGIIIAIICRHYY